ncbi:MAG: hypothetical protein KF684_00010 [Phycisphaeraceae bacterium]|nr:hypothetical protein [Phycisphaeraceae bacterium]
MPVCLAPRHAIALAVGLSVSAGALAQLRVAAWNISNYSGGRVAAIHASVYGEFEGRSMAPDVFLLQEFLSESALSQFVAALNGAPGSPGDWAAAPFVNGPDTDSAFAYRTTRVELLNTVVVSMGGVNPNHPRNIMRYDFRPVGYAAPQTVVASYSVHMKAGSTSTDQARRLVEAQRIRDDAEQLPGGWNFVVGGDFNIQSSNQAAYQELVGSQANDDGRFFDPINTPGSWNNNGSFRIVHTQDPIGAGGMDDRHDQILISGSLVEQGGFAYIGTVNPGTGLPVPYSTTTWNDPNHSYRAWGNDGTSFDTTLRVAGNTMVGPVIAQALIDMCNGAGHLPVFMDFRVPAVVGSDEFLDFGTVALGETATAELSVFNAGDVDMWTESGIATLRYTLDATSGFSAPSGDFADAPGGGVNTHTIVMDTSVAGQVIGTLTILSDAPDEPARVVTLSGFVLGGVACPGDTNGDGVVNFADLNAVLSEFGQSGDEIPGDLNNDGVVNFADLNEVLSNFGAECE